MAAVDAEGIKKVLGEKTCDEKKLKRLAWLACGHVTGYQFLLKFPGIIDNIQTVYKVTKSPEKDPKTGPVLILMSDGGFPHYPAVSGAGGVDPPTADSTGVFSSTN